MSTKKIALKKNESMKRTEKDEVKQSPEALVQSDAKRKNMRKGTRNGGRRREK